MKAGPKWIANLFIVLFIDWLFYFGWLITRRAFCDSDSCWLLAMGRWIFAHHSLPMIDPFSSGVSAFSTLSPDLPLVQYQWLTEVLFYSIYHVAGLLGLVLLISLVGAIAFICLPYLSLSKFNCPPAIAFVIILAIIEMVHFSMFLRPQMFSNLFLSLLIYLYVPTWANLKQIRNIPLILTLLIMLLWTNMHIFFPLGIIFILMILILRFAEIKVLDRDGEFKLSQFAIPVVAILPTFINPWNTGIWVFLERLRSTTNSELINELKPLQMFPWYEGLALAMWCLLAVYILLCFYYRAYKISRLGFVSPFLFFIGLYLSLQHLRMTTITALFIGAACLELVGRQSRNKPAIGAISGLGIFWNDINSHLEKQLSKRVVWLSIMLSSVLLGSAFNFVCWPVSLPQTSELFQVPYKAIDYLKTHRPPGKIYNDPRFGSVMIWYLNNPDVYIDTRFSQYDPHRLPEFIQMEACEYDWKNLWQKHNFDWIFVRPTRPLVRALRKENWKTVYEDRTAVILTKP